jgi:pseudouridine kinase
MVQGCFLEGEGSNLLETGLTMSKKMIARVSDRVFEHKKVVVIGGANYDITGTATGALVKGTSNPGKVQTGIGGVGGRR